MSTKTDTELTAAGFKLTVIEKPRARETISRWGTKFWTVWLPSSLNKKHPIWGQGRTLEEAYKEYERRKNNVLQMKPKT